MKNLFILLLIVIFCACKESTNPAIEKDNFTKNLSLAELYKSDQADRQTANIDWSVVSVRDEQRRLKVREILDANKVVTSDDYANAAMVFQHGSTIPDSEMAVKLMQKAVDLDSSRSKWLLAAAIDRDLMRKDKAQIYGTQYTKKGANDPWVMHDLDTTVVSDAQRREYGVETLAEQKEKLKMMNKKKLNSFLEAGKSIDELIAFIKTTDLENSEYNLSQGGINSFGYQLMREEKSEAALKIFKLNTELYPEGYNTFDSYGEALLKFGKTDAGITAYEKSLELNPKNDNATKVLKEIRKQL